MALDWCDSKLRREFLKDSAMWLRPWSGEGVCKPIIFSADPSRLGSVVVLDLVSGVQPGHTQSVVVGGPPVLNEKEATF